MTKDRPKKSRPKNEQERYEAGLTVRRAVLGDAYVEQSLANLTPFNAPFQDFITRYAWGEIWDRPGLPRQTRSLITLAMLVALNQGDELRMHIRAALHNGVTIEEIQEVSCNARSTAACQRRTRHSTWQRMCWRPTRPNRRLSTAVSSRGISPVHVLPASSILVVALIKCTMILHCDVYMRLSPLTA